MEKTEKIISIVALSIWILFSGGAGIGLLVSSNTNKELLPMVTSVCFFICALGIFFLINLSRYLDNFPENSING